MTRDDVCSVAYDLARINNFKVPFNPQKKKSKQRLVRKVSGTSPRTSLRQPEATSFPKPLVSINLEWINSLIC